MIRKNDENIFIRVLRFIKYNKLITFVIAIGLFMLFFIFFSDKGYLTRIKFQKEKDRIEKQVAEEKKKQDSLRKVIDSLTNSNDMIEKIARERYYMSKEGEIIYKVEQDTNDAK
ncbi:MAG: septum formation initiator family protein [Candidatus Kapaibacterium sp.]